MKETLIKFEKSKISGKKYTAYIQNKATKKIRKIHFGASDIKIELLLNYIRIKTIIIANACKTILIDIQEPKNEDRLLHSKKENRTVIIMQKS
jgi:hypothetical protein